MPGSPLRLAKISTRMMLVTVLLIVATIASLATGEVFLGIILLIITIANALTGFIIAAVFSRRVTRLKRAADSPVTPGDSPLRRISGR
jgi:hypothetical protein